MTDFHAVTLNRVSPHIAVADLADNETRVPQYSPAWLAHVAAGGAVRNGNILIAD